MKTQHTQTMYKSDIEKFLRDGGIIKHLPDQRPLQKQYTVKETTRIGRLGSQVEDLRDILS